MTIRIEGIEQRIVSTMHIAPLRQNHFVRSIPIAATTRKDIGMEICIAPSMPPFKGPPSIVSTSIGCFGIKY